MLPDSLSQVCHKAAKNAWAQTTRTYGRSQRQRRPSYCLHRSSGAALRGIPDAVGNTASTADAAGWAPAEEGNGESPTCQAAQMCVI